VIRFLSWALGILVAIVVMLALGASSALAADSLNVALSDATPVRGVPITVTFSGADTPFNTDGATPELYALVRPANGIPCQATFGADLQVSGTTNVTQVYNSNNNGSTVSSGNYSYAASVTPTAGTYLVCAWLETVTNDDSGAGYTSNDVTASATTLIVTPGTILPHRATATRGWVG
jgi:hypothetical protein